MFVKSISNNFIDNYGRVFKRITDCGKFKDMHITIDSYAYKGKQVFEKRYVIWNDKFQKIVNKIRKPDGKFERIG